MDEETVDQAEKDYERDALTHANEMSQLSNEELARLTRKGNSAAILERLIRSGN